MAEMGTILEREIGGWDDLLREEASRIIDKAKEAQQAQANGKKQHIPEVPQPTARPKQQGQGKIDWSRFWQSAKNLGYDKQAVHDVATEIYGVGVASLTEVIFDQKQANELLEELAKRKQVQDLFNGK